MPALPRLRAYEPADAAAVRRICFETALFGRPIRAVLDDERLVTEALAGYYLRYEPELTFVADAGGVLAGYVSGCADTRRFRRRYALRIVPRLLVMFIRHGHVRRPAAWGWLQAGLRLARRRAALPGDQLRDYPAHAHLNLAAAWRRQGLGTRLLDHLLGALRARGIRGLHVSAASPDGQAFFRRAGFRQLAEYPAPADGGLPPHSVWILGLRL